MSDASTEKNVSSVCECCGKKNPKKLIKIYFSLKRGARMKAQKWCKECYDDHQDDFCDYCGCNSFGSIPCAGCRRDSKRW